MTDSTAWADLFERAAAFDADEEVVITTLLEHRDDRN